MKKCNKCGEIKPLSEFHKRKDSKDGHAYHCKVCIGIYRSNHYVKNVHKIREYAREYSLNYYYENRDSRREYLRKYQQKHVYIVRWRALLFWTLKRLDTSKSQSTHKLLGYSAEDLREHLNALGMDWEHHQIDHKIPVSWFKDDTPPSIVNDLRNLQPSSVEANTSKGNRYMDEIPEDYAREVVQYIKEDYLNFF